MQLVNPLCHHAWGLHHCIVLILQLTTSGSSGSTLKCWTSSFMHSRLFSSAAMWNAVFPICSIHAAGTDAHASMHLSDIYTYMTIVYISCNVWMKPLMQETKRQHCASGREAVHVNADRFVEGEQSAWGVVMYSYALFCCLTQLELWQDTYRIVDHHGHIEFVDQHLDNIRMVSTNGQVQCIHAILNWTVADRGWIHIHKKRRRLYIWQQIQFSYCALDIIWIQWS